MIAINEIFGPTIQGEGKSAGRAVVFIRLALCNLKCVWCDTPYTWNWNTTNQKGLSLPVFSKEDELHRMSIEEILAKVKTYSNEQTDAIVISGGEPLLQQKQLLPMLVKLKQLGYWIEVETNGTIVPLKGFLETINQINCSPKLQNSGNPLEKRRKLLGFQHLAQLPITNFKFVISCESDIEETLTIVKYLRNYGNPEIRLMPLSQTKVELLSRESLVKDLCDKHNFIYCTRLSILKSGTKRGV